LQFRFYFAYVEGAMSLHNTQQNGLAQPHSWCHASSADATSSRHRCVSVQPEHRCLRQSAASCAATIHDRMPVIPHPRDFARWLDGEETHQPPIDLLRPLPADVMEAFEVSKDVGNVKNNSPELLGSQTKRVLYA
jgi:hypothetical protein